jgi:hypothetical protein
MRRAYQALQAEPHITGLYVALAKPEGSDRQSLPQAGSAAAGVLRHWFTGSRAANAAAATLR